MTAYRFTRPDDIPYLVRAVNECFDVHFPDRPALTVERFREEMKHLDLWPSNSMVAAADTEPVAVLTATKRDDETLVSRIGARPGHEREGHCGHLLTSLGQKLAVLGPPGLAVEVPASRPGALELFRSLGWREEAVYTDLVRPAGSGEADAGLEPVPEGLVGPVTVAELDGAGALEGSGPRRGGEGPVAWERRVESLRGRSDRLRGAALASPDRVEGWVLWEEGAEALDVVAWGAAEAERESLMLSLLLRHLLRQTPATRLRLAKTGEGEIPPEVLDELGLAAGERYHRLVTEAKPL